MTLLAAICICAATWRKRTIGARWETSATVGLALVAAGELLANSESLNAALTVAFGVTKLDDFAGNLCYLASAIAFLCHILERLTVDNYEVREMITGWAQGPLTVVVAVMFACLLQAQGNCADRVLLTHSAGQFDWLDAYGTAWYLGMIYLTTIGMRLLLILHRERRSLSVDMYLAAAAASLTSCALRVSSFVLDSAAFDDVARTLGEVSIILACAAASWSWHTKMRPYRKLLRKTRTAPSWRCVARRRTPDRGDGREIRFYGPPL